MCYFVWSTKRRMTERQAAKIDRAVKKIDDTMSFVGPLDIPGNDTRGWLERPNDGTNDYNDVRARNQQCAAIAEKIIYPEAN